MAVSLSMLQHRLTRFCIENHDDHKLKDISAFCLYAPGVLHREKVLYVGMYREFFPLLDDGDPDEIVLYYQGDYLLLHTEDKVAVVNELIGIFGLYNHWENSLKQKIASGCTPQELLDLSDEIFDTPLLVLDRTDYIFAITKKYETVPVNEGWFEMVQRRSVTTDQIMRFHDAEQRIYDPDSREPFYLESFFPRPCYSINLFSGDTFLGILVMIEYGHPFHEGMVDELIVLSSHIRMWIERNSSFDTFSREQSCLLDAVYGVEGGIDNLKRLLAISGWEPDHKMQLFYAKAISQVFNIDAFLCRVLASSSPYIRAASTKEGCLFLCNFSKTSEQSFLSLFEQWLKQSKYYYGSSIEFTDLNQITAAYRQACIALKYGIPESAAHNSIENAALPYILEVLKETVPIELCHPIVRDLREYDGLHGTDLRQTLFVYLLNRQNHVVTSEKLHVHRNTLNQRITRLKNQFEIDFEDGELCLYLLLSLYISSDPE